ncbi:carbonic anhydrase [Oecophyllibacter saccharovorans]|uniref:Carbonic anhydrase n=1 Tax=Oecophyllibacter saccharovorans TaxID=2558360 RepID=A0A506UMB4_9PROT|nr:carbonic anhydrase [Oecophyllibacter saccharovorans]QDH15643.1 carbonic anhydrase [Oecophyllibacter saccharovorans]TPW34478.1 carbonic anhydrase [Oecophyllibacter saccharovorans]TPW36662.1 carbonic anhydrase [Oecophyllibacter saccharovorans]
MGFQHNTLLELLGGVREFETDVYPENEKLFKSLAYTQQPPTLFITCADSRISPGMLTQTEPGELFLIRNVGNIVPAYGNMVGSVTSAIEYAVGALKVKNIIICGHSNCGAMNALLELNSPKLDAMPTVRRWLCNAEAALASLPDLKAEDAGPEEIKSLAEANVRLQLAHLRTHPVVARALARQELEIEGWYYDIKNGVVKVLDEHSPRSYTVEEAIAYLKDQKKAQGDTPASGS